MLRVRWRPSGLLVLLGVGLGGCAGDLALPPPPTFGHVEGAALVYPPSARYGAVAAWDATNQRMIVVGGYDNTTFKSDVWTLSFATPYPSWKQWTPQGSAVPTRFFGAGAWDEAGHRLVLFGGENGAGYLNDAYTLTFTATTATWAALSPSGTAPTARNGASGVWDPGGSRLILFGGANDSTVFADVWTLTFSGATSAWAKVTPAGTAPAARFQQSAVWDAANGRVIVFGGALSGTSLSADTWSLTLGATPTWAKLSPAGTAPSARYRQTAVWDAAGSRMLMFGGKQSSGSLNDVWTLTFSGAASTWAKLEPTGGPPSTREIHSMVIDPADGAPVVFGGFHGLGSVNDTWILSFAVADGKWVQTGFSCEAAPPKPTLTSPASGAILSSCQPTLTWSTSGTTTGYGYEVFLNGSKVGVTGALAYPLPAGTPLLATGNTWQVKSTGCGGAGQLSASATFDLSSGAPSVPMQTLPANNATAYCDVTFSWDSTGGFAGDTHDLLIGTTLPLATKAAGLTTTTYTPAGADRLADGTYVWQVQTRRCTGEVASSNYRTVVVNNAPPAPVPTFPADGKWASELPTFQWTNVGAKPDVTYTIRVDGIAIASAITTTAYAAKTSLSPGPHTWSVDAVGCMGSATSSGQEIAIKVDAAAPPPFSLLAPADGTWVNAPPVTFSWQPSVDADSGTTSYKVRFDYTDIGMTLGSFSSLAWKVPETITEGAHKWSVNAYDYVGHTRASAKSFTLGIDRTAPSAAAGVKPLVSASTKPIFSWTAATDAVSGIAFYDVIVGTSVVAIAAAPALSAKSTVELGEGPWSFKVRARDQAGNALDSVLSTMFIDLTPPGAPSLVSPAEGAYVSSLTPDVVFNGTTDNVGGSGIDHYDVVVDGASVAAVVPGPSPMTSTALGLEGPHSWLVRAIDEAGWSRDSETRHFTTETQPPTAFTHASPANGSTSPTWLPQLCWHPSADSGSGLDHYTVTVFQSSTVVQSATAPPVVGSDPACIQLPSPLANGTYTWLVTATDKAGLITKANGGTAWTLSIANSNTGPTSVVTSPVEGQVITSTPVTVSGSATAIGGVLSVEVCFDAPCVWAPATLNGSAWSYVWSDGPQGPHKTYVRATDKSGTVQTTATARSFTLDTVGPSAFDLTAPADGAWTGPKPTFAWQAATDGGTGLLRYELLIVPAPGDPATATPIDTGTKASYAPAIAMADGDYAWQVRALDKAGHGTVSTSGRLVHIDGEPPSDLVALGEDPTTVIEGATWNGTGVATLSWSAASDPGSGLVSKPYSVYINGKLAAATDATSLSTTALADGLVSWYVVASDKVGNTATSATRTFSVDTKAPPVSAVSSFKLTGKHVPSSPLATNIALTAGETLRILASGDLCYTSDARCSDACTSPEGVEPTPGPAKYFGYATHPFGKVMAFVGSPASATAIGSFGLFTSASAGKLSLTTNHAASVDCPGRWATVAVQKGAGFNLFAPGDGDYIGTPYPIFKWTVANDGGVGIDTIRLLIDGQLAIEDLPVFAGSVPAPLPLGEGKHMWQLVATDRLGHSSASATWSFVIDVSSPGEFAVTTPADGQLVTLAQPNIAWSASVDAPLADGAAGAGVSRYEVWLDGTFAVALHANTLSWMPTTPLAEGTHDVVVKAFDLFDTDAEPRRAETPQSSFVVDIGPPVPFDLVAPASGANVCSLDPTFCWEAPIDLGTTGNAHYVLHVGSHEEYIPPGTGATVCVQVASQQIYGNALGTGTWWVHAVDTLNRSTDSELRPITIYGDTEAPVVTIDGVANGACVGPGGIDLQGTIVETQPECAAAITSVMLDYNGGTGPQALLDLKTHTWTAHVVATTGPIVITGAGRDALANVTAPADRAVLELIGDLVPPDTLAGITPEFAWLSATPTFEWTEVKDIGCGMGTYAVSIDGKEVAAGLTTTSYTVPANQPLAQGQHDWQVVATDLAGLTWSPGPYWFAIDLTPPSAPVVMSPPDSAWLSDTTPTLGWKSSTDSVGAVAGYRLTLDGVAVVATVAGLSWTAPPLGEGLHHWHVEAIDYAGNVGPSSDEATFGIDVTPPSAPLAISPADGAVVGAAPVTLQWTIPADGATDASAGLCGYEGALGGVVFESKTSSATLTPWSGTASWHVHATDCAGNVGAESADRSLIVDGTPPSLSVDPPGGIASTPWVVTLTTDDPAAVIHATLDGLPPSASSPVVSGPIFISEEGSTEVRAVAIDAAGNESASVDEMYVVDTTPPTLSVTPPAGTYASTLTAEVSADEPATVVVTTDGAPPSPGSPAAPAPVAVVLDTEGTVTLQAIGLDAAGNASEPVEVDYVLDWTAPTVAIVPGGGVFAAPQSVTFVASEAAVVHVTTDGTSATEAASVVDGPVLVVTEGITQVSAIAVDVAGNVGAPSTAVLLIDMTPPGAPEIVAPADGATVTVLGPTLSWLAAVDGPLAAPSGVCQYGGTVDGKPFLVDGATTSIATALLTPGPVTWSLHAIDCAGNVGPVASATFTVTVVAPVVTISPAGGTYGAPQTITLSSNPSAPIHLTLDGTDPTLASTLYDAPWMDSVEGATEVRAAAETMTGELGPVAEAMVVIDTVPPTEPTLTAPADGAWTHEMTPDLCWTPSTDAMSGVAAYTLTVDATDAWSGSSAPSCVASQLTDGDHVWTVRATDGAGHAASAATRVVRVDTAPPSSQVAPIVAPPGPVTLSGAAADVGSGVAYVDVQIDDGPWIAAVVDGVALAAWSATIGVLDAGDHVARSRATDVAGNVEVPQDESPFTVAASPCESLPDLALGKSHIDTTSGRPNAFDPSGSCAPDGAPGSDAAFHLALADGDAVRITVTPSDNLDPLVYALSDCESEACFVTADSAGAGEVEVLHLMASGPLVLVIDSSLPGGGAFSVLAEKEPDDGEKGSELDADVAVAVATEDTAGDPSAGADTVSPSAPDERLPAGAEEQSNVPGGANKDGGGCMDGTGSPAGTPVTVLVLLVLLALRHRRATGRHRPSQNQRSP